MTLYAGVDSGSWNTKAVIIDDDARVLGSAVLRSGADLGAAAERCYTLALAGARQTSAEVAAVWATGFGRQAVGFANGSRTELDCHSDPAGRGGTAPVASHESQVRGGNGKLP
jgi:activator of 2-hydroxyglutaryl-CoA dehydratase